MELIMRHVGPFWLWKYVENICCVNLPSSLNQHFPSVLKYHSITSGKTTTEWQIFSSRRGLWLEKRALLALSQNSPIFSTSRFPKFQAHNVLCAYYAFNYLCFYSAAPIQWCKAKTVHSKINSCKPTLHSHKCNHVGSSEIKLMDKTKPLITQLIYDKQPFTTTVTAWVETGIFLPNQ